jgi:pyruvate/2-oxoglutarate dehydrogenase complex dihydrolipoamide dehydrogenase (E3) component
VASVGTFDGDGVVSRATTSRAGACRPTSARGGGFVKLAADGARRVLVGAIAVGSEAGEWLGQLTLAVRAAVPIDVLLDTIQPYPTFSESIFNALRELESALAS